MSNRGPFITGTGADDATVGTRPWSNPEFITADDSSDAIADAGFETNSFVSLDNSIKLVKNGVISGNEKSVGAALSSPAYTLNTYGGETDTWGLSLTPADINASDFGVVYSAKIYSTPIFSHYLKATNFGFSIPTNATIKGVIVGINKRYSSVCFLQGTLIQTPNGDILVENLKPGTEVFAFDKNHNIVISHVKDIFGVECSLCVRLKTETTEGKTSPEHPYFTEGSKWVKAKDVVVGDRIFVLKDGIMQLEKVGFVEAIKENSKKYKLEIDKFHTYFGNGLASHNKPGGFSQALVDYVQITVYYDEAPTSYFM